MEIKIEISRESTKRLLVLGVVLFVALTVTVVRAVPVSFKDGDTLTAAQLNQNFADLETRMKAVEATVHPISAFHAILSTAQSIPTTLRTTIAFDQVEFDLANEYNKTTGGFTATQAGVYAFSCAFEIQADVSGNFFAVIRKNGVDVFGADWTVSATNGASPQCSGITKLAMGDTVTCAAYQSTGAPLPLSIAADLSRNSFSGARLY